MQPIKQFRTVNASLWQSAVDQVIARSNAQAIARKNAVSPAAGLSPHAGVSDGNLARPDQSDEMMIHANAIAQALENGEIPETPAPSPAAGIVDTIGFCSATALRLAEARVKAFFTHDDAELKMLHAQLDTPFSQCDPRWAQVLEVYATSRIADKTIPYRRYKDIGDFVISDRLPAKATIALLADWGTGQECAKALLERVAARHPDVVIHLGDVYYSGTQHEVQNYFYGIWQKTLGLPKVAWGQIPGATQKPATFHLAGNHDMYAGGRPYYTVIDMLGQPASYFCLRNKHWQFLAMDTGLHDSDPVKEGSATWLEDTEVEWLKDKVNNAAGRKTILLSHHQLYSAYENIGQGPVNEKLFSQLEDILPKVTAWFWGHEHNLAIYGKYRNVLGRCIGYSAFPVSCEDLKAPNPDVPVAPVALSTDQDGFFEHGYVTMEIDGPEAKVAYYQHNADGTETAIFTERL
jgi:hypothetical protein